MKYVFCMVFHGDFFIFWVWFSVYEATNFIFLEMFFRMFINIAAKFPTY